MIPQSVGLLPHDGLIIGGYIDALRLTFVFYSHRVQASVVIVGRIRSAYTTNRFVQKPDILNYTVRSKDTW